MAAAPFISTDVWQQISQPASKFYPDYLAFRTGAMKRAELIDRLPHVAMIGDSVCMNIHVSSAWNTFWRARTRRQESWFVERDPSSPTVRSVASRLAEITPVVAQEYAGIGAMVDAEGEREWFSRRIMGTRNFSGQIAQLINANRFPDLILISIGHNNVDWAWRCPPHEFQQLDERLRRQANRFSEDFARQTRRLIAHAGAQRHRVAIVVYGLVNFERYFIAREAAEALRRKNPELYPHLETTYEYFTSFRPEYRKHLVRLAKMINDSLCSSVQDLRRQSRQSSNFRLDYSDALARTDLGKIEFLHEIDGWHASPEGHRVLAAAAFSALGPSLNFLGIRT